MPASEINTRVASNTDNHCEHGFLLNHRELSVLSLFGQEPRRWEKSQDHGALIALKCLGSFIVITVIFVFCRPCETTIDFGSESASTYFL